MSGLPDDLLLIARWEDEDATRITLQDFVVAGRSVIPVWTAEDAFAAQTAGSGFETQGVWIKRSFLHDMLHGSEILMLNPGAADRVELAKRDLAA